MTGRDLAPCQLTGVRSTLDDEHSDDLGCVSSTPTMKINGKVFKGDLFTAVRVPDRVPRACGRACRDHHRGGEPERVRFPCRLGSGSALRSAVDAELDAVVVT